MTVFLGSVDAVNAAVLSTATMRESATRIAPSRIISLLAFTVMTVAFVYKVDLGDDILAKKMCLLQQSTDSVCFLRE